MTREAIVYLQKKIYFKHRFLFSGSLNLFHIKLSLNQKSNCQYDLAFFVFTYMQLMDKIIEYRLNTNDSNIRFTSPVLLMLFELGSVVDEGLFLLVLFDINMYCITWWFCGYFYRISNAVDVPILHVLVYLGMASV